MHLLAYVLHKCALMQAAANNHLCLLFKGLEFYDSVKFGYEYPLTEVKISMYKDSCMLPQLYSSANLLIHAFLKTLS